MGKKLSCFKAYDIRGQIGLNFDNEIAYKIGRALGIFLGSGTVVIAGDIRLTSDEIKYHMTKGIRESGLSVVDIGMCGTEEIYFATSYLGVDAGVEITASHNPIDYNGMKIVLKDSKPLGQKNGLDIIKKIAESECFSAPHDYNNTKLVKLDLLAPYVDKIFSFINISNLTKLKIVINSGNGAAGKVIDEIEDRFKKSNVDVEIIKIHNEPNGNFPHGIPNPLLPDGREDTIKAILENQADFGVAFDGDFDRCFFFDNNGRFIEGYYVVGLLAKNFLSKEPNSKIIHDPRLVWNTQDLVNQFSGVPIVSKTGHAFIKQSMREHDAIYGGEMSAHHYFRDFYYCDSGMIPWLIISEILSLTGDKLSSMVDDMIEKYPSTGEINIKTENYERVLSAIQDKYTELSTCVDYLDGMSFEFPDWRFNIRTSNTEPLVRLNIESRMDSTLLDNKKRELLKLINENM